jgi:hypothetical protein
MHKELFREKKIEGENYIFFFHSFLSYLNPNARHTMSNRVVFPESCLEPHNAGEESTVTVSE